MPVGIALEDFDKNHTGYTNRYLQVRNDLKTVYPYRGEIMYDESQQAKPSDYIYSVIKDMEKNPLNAMFFSQKNLDYLQELIKKVIYKETGYVIGRQSDVDLLIIMRAKYLQDGKNQPYELEKQVAELNYLALKYAVYDQILPKVKGYNIYLNDNFRTNVVLPRDKYVNSKGSRINRGFADLI